MNHVCSKTSLHTASCLDHRR